MWAFGWWRSLAACCGSTVSRCLFAVPTVTSITLPRVMPVIAPPGQDLLLMKRHSFNARCAVPTIPTTPASIASAIGSVSMWWTGGESGTHGT